MKFILLKNLYHNLFSCCWGQIFYTTWNLFHWQSTPHQQIMDFGKTSFKDQKSLYSQNDTKAHGPIPMVILSHQSPWFKLTAHHLIFYSWSKLMSLIKEILGVMVWRVKKYIQKSPNDSKLIKENMLLGMSSQFPELWPVSVQ